ncbi:MAG: amino acid racemase [Ignavibacteriales bacterium]|nr:MAG: amino acid racemase [Ignavibacteriales bacterium]
MKTIGLIGGTGWLSTIEYYRELNLGINKKLGGLSSARIILDSYNYGDIDKLNKAENHEGILRLLIESANKLQQVGAECILLCANTLHMHAEKLIENISVPLIHIGDATATEIKRHNISTIALLGTKWTMEMDFYKTRLSNSAIKSLVPSSEEINFIHSAIMNELLKEDFRVETKNRFLEIINNLLSQGAEGVVLGCTEIPLIISQKDFEVPVFNTLQLHANAAVDFALL